MVVYSLIVFHDDGTYLTGKHLTLTGVHQVIGTTPWSTHYMRINQSDEILQWNNAQWQPPINEQQAKTAMLLLLLES